MAASLIKRIPSPVFAASMQAAARTFFSTGEGWDFAIGGLPFNGAASEQRPLVRQTAPSRKEQADTSREPGEHSLAFWWTKAQSSFHGGAGRKFQTTEDSDSVAQYRYQISEGLDVFSQPGKASPVRATTRMLVAAGSAHLALADNAELYVANGSSLALYYLTPLQVGKDKPSDPHGHALRATIAWGGSSEIKSLAAGGGRYYLATEDGIWRGEGSAAATKIYSLPGGATPKLAFVKQRLILALDGASSSPVYELDQTAASGTALPAALFSVGPSWKWAAITQTPNAVLLAGSNGARSAVYRVSLDTSGAVPLLTPGVVSAEFPPGEVVTGMETYLGTVIGVQTTAGFRVGVLNNTGDFQYGSLLFEHTYGATSSAVFGGDNSLYAGWQDSKGAAGLVRVDLSEAIGSNQALRFPWAPDLRAMDNTTTTVSGVVSDGTLWTKGRRVFVVPGKGVYVESDETNSVACSLTTSRIRWGTLEPKVVRFLRVRGEGSSGRINIDISRDSDDNFTSVGAIEVARQSDSGDMYVQIPPAQYVVIRFTLTGGAALAGYQLKALPAQRRQRFLQVPLNCFDREVDNSGQIVGGDNSAMGRLLALEQLEQTGDIVAFQWLNAQPDMELVEYVTVEQVEFAQSSGPSDRRGWGGVVTLTLRTVG